MLKSFVVQILHDSFLGATAAQDFGCGSSLSARADVMRNEAHKPRSAFKH